MKRKHCCDVILCQRNTERESVILAHHPNEWRKTVTIGENFFEKTDKVKKKKKEEKEMLVTSVNK